MYQERCRTKESPSNLANGAYKVLVVLDVLAEALHDALQLANPALEVVKRAFDIGYLFANQVKNALSAIRRSRPSLSPEAAR